MFNVIRTWSNWDAIRETIVGTFPTREAAEQDAVKRAEKSFGNAYLVRPVEAGYCDCEMFAPQERNSR